MNIRDQYEIWDEYGPPIRQIGPRVYELMETVTDTIRRYKITIEKGFIFDGASIPRIFWSIIGSPFTGSYTTGALFHDSLYHTKFLSKEEADLIFLELMENKRVHPVKRQVIYNSVKYFAGSAYNKPHMQRDLVRVERPSTVETLGNFVQMFSENIRGPLEDIHKEITSRPWEFI